MRVIVTGDDSLAWFVRAHLADAGHAIQHHWDGCEAVVHLDGQANVAASYADPIATYLANVSRTLNLLDAMRDVDCHYLVIASAAEAAEPATSPYAASKKMIELLLPSIDAAYPLSYIAMRMHEVVTPGAASLLAEAVACALEGRALRLPAKWEARDFIAASDVATAIAAALTVLPHYHLNGIMDIGSGTPITVDTLAAAIKTATGKPLIIERTSDDQALTPRLVADIAMAKTMLSWRPKHTLVQMTAECAAAHGAVPRA